MGSNLYLIDMKQVGCACGCGQQIWVPEGFEGPVYVHKVENDTKGTDKTAEDTDKGSS